MQAQTHHGLSSSSHTTSPEAPMGHPAPTARLHPAVLKDRPTVGVFLLLHRQMGLREGKQKFPQVHGLL